ncbi:MaoC family dehydratase [Arthrobacter sp. GCM10027362]|uniref:MaoC family dehydratase n=1 Tax=Arthrobacter sp. GCM10027362 TaxID=3273379 RepID=UPI0036302489
MSTREDDAAPAGRLEEVRLDELPSVSKLLVHAATTAARESLSGASRPQQLPPVRHTAADVRVDLDRLTRFQHLVGGTVRDTLPSVFLHTVAFPVAMSLLTRPDFPLPLPGLVHLANSVRQQRAVHFAEPLTVSAWVENLRGHHAGTRLDVRTEVLAAGEPAWQGTSEYLAKGVFRPGLDTAVRPPREDFAPPAPTARWRLGAEAGREYAVVSGDFNPIHLSALSARLLGMKRSMAHGMYLASRVLADIEAVAGDRHAWDIRFAAPVYLPAAVALRIEDECVEDRWVASRFTAWGEHSRRLYFAGGVRAL